MNVSKENESLFKFNKEDCVFEKLEDPYATILCMTEDDFNKQKEAFERQISKKPIRQRNIGDFIRGDCPNCVEEVHVNSYFDFCPKCGQKLDWREEK